MGWVLYQISGTDFEEALRDVMRERDVEVGIPAQRAALAPAHHSIVLLTHEALFAARCGVWCRKRGAAC